MAEEKILEGEVLAEEELEGVVGGYYQTWGDYVNIKKLEADGKGTFYHGVYTYDGVEKAFKKIGEKLGINISSKLYFDGKPGKNPNKYYVDGKQISRDELWSIINEGFAAN